MTVFFMLAIYGMATRQAQSRPLRWETAVNRHRPGTLSCGATLEEAISRNCVFDELSMMWMPQKCTQSYNRQYTSANHGGPWDYWLDEKGEQSISDPSQHTGDGQTFWTTTRAHVVHCQYNLYRLVHALKTGDYIGQMDDSSISDHMHHCIRTMADFAMKAPAEGLDIVDVIVEPSFGWC